MEGDRYPEQYDARFEISIHALRVEGDHPSAKSISKKFYFYPRPPGGGRPFQLSTGLPQKHFYPRPPGGGRRAPFFALCSICRFLSTPSGWRATRTHKITEHHTVFLSTPSGWRATHSIYQDMLKLRYFYPRPPGGGRLSHSMFPRTAETISIHALRVEGDKIAPFVKHLHYISIHALRVEGDKSIFDRLRRRIRNFYPRPPGGGRPFWTLTSARLIPFLSTPSGWRATAKTDKVFICFCAKGRRICLFKTRKEKNLPVVF